jgi:phage FluMu protein Com
MGRVSGVGQQSFEVECPHCHKSFDAEPMAGGRAARYRGFKCPHCKLFVPLERAADRALIEPLSRDTDAAS